LTNTGRLILFCQELSLDSSVFRCCSPADWHSESDLNRNYGSKKGSIMAEITKVTGRAHSISFKVTKAVVEKIEKWSETSFSTTSTASGGGGLIYQGSGYISPTQFSTTTSSSTTRHTRIYYSSNIGSSEITAYEMDLPIVEGSVIDISWYTCIGFQDKVAGFLDSRNNRWYMLNSPDYYLLHWLGIPWISFQYIFKYTSIAIIIVFITCLFNKILGSVTFVVVGVIWLMRIGKALIRFITNFLNYSYKYEFDSVSIALKKGSSAKSVMTLRLRQISKGVI
jgi:hypothetical protein